MASSTVMLYTFYSPDKPNIAEPQLPILTTLLTVPIITVSKNEPFTTITIPYYSQVTLYGPPSYTTVIDVSVSTNGTTATHFENTTIYDSRIATLTDSIIAGSAEEIIYAVIATSTPQASSEPTPSSEPQPPKTLSGGALAGIIVGVVAVMTFLLLVVFVIRRRKIRKQRAHRTGDVDAKAPVSKGGNERFEKPELPNQELPRTHGRAELDSARPPIPGTVSSISNKAELPSDMHDEIHELAPGSSQLEGIQSSRTHVGSGTSAGGPLDDSTRDSQPGYGEQTSGDMLNASPSIRHDGPARSDTPPETITTTAEAEPARQQPEPAREQPEPARQQPEPFDYSTWGVM